MVLYLCIFLTRFRQDEKSNIIESNFIVSNIMEDSYFSWKQWFEVKIHVYYKHAAFHFTIC